MNKPYVHIIMHEMAKQNALEALEVFPASDAKVALSKLMEIVLTRKSQIADQGLDKNLDATFYNDSFEEG